MNGWMDVWVDLWVNEWMHELGWMDGWMDGSGVLRGGINVSRSVMKFAPESASPR
jgi:hypothetical protein